jgi:hypothetical protein
MTALRAVEAENENARNHGGARPGAGRKPKALRYASELAAAEERMMSTLPIAIEALETAAKGGDVAAAKYLLDRAFGRVKEQAAPVAEDTAIPFSAADLERDETTKAYRDSLGSW